jgi:hypothetical protein
MVTDARIELIANLLGQLLALAPADGVVYAEIVIGAIGREIELLITKAEPSGEAEAGMTVGQFNKSVEQTLHAFALAAPEMMH